MKTTNLQKVGIRAQIRASLSAIFEDSHDREEIADMIEGDVVSDIEATADWSGYEDDEFNLNDISIAMARVLKERICKG